MYSMKKDKYYIYNEKESRKRYSPDSTYKIYLALFGLDRHIISDKIHVCYGIIIIILSILGIRIKI